MNVFIFVLNNQHFKYRICYICMKIQDHEQDFIIRKIQSLHGFKNQRINEHNRTEQVCSYSHTRRQEY